MYVFYWLNSTEKYHKMKLSIETEVFSFDTYNLS